MIFAVKDHNHSFLLIQLSWKPNINIERKQVGRKNDYKSLLTNNILNIFCMFEIFPGYKIRQSITVSYPVPS